MSYTRAIDLWGTALRYTLKVAILFTPAVAIPAISAEQIYIPFGLLEISVPVSSLERYATTGIIDDQLRAYTGYLNSQQLEQLRQILRTPVDVSPVAIAQFLYSPQGEIILERVGELIQTKAGQPGFYAIRAALIKAAAYPEGLTLLNVLREFPTYGIRINSQRGFQVLDEVSRLIQETQAVIAAVEQQWLDRAREQMLNTAQLSDLRQLESIPYSITALNLNDLQRQRQFAVDLYLPELPQGQSASLIIISHGLGSDRQTFQYLATHLASYGFAVAVPEHPGSNAAQIQALLSGFADQVTPATEFINRPKDISFLLDYLEANYSRQLNLLEVGIIGQSFGGYTALALAGAAINFERLQQQCDRANDFLNLSVILQCHTLDLPLANYQLQDERIAAVIAINPITSKIFGQAQLSQIDIPVMLVAGSADTVAPALSEQIRPFTWLTTPEKYMVLLRRGTHFSTLAASSEGIPLPESVIGPDPAIGHEYIQALSVAFFKTYIAEKPNFQVYLTAAYAQYISQQLMPLRLIETLQPSQLPTPENVQERFLSE